jgi:hypothetical protein
LYSTIIQTFSVFVLIHCCCINHLLDPRTRFPSAAASQTISQTSVMPGMGSLQDPGFGLYSALPGDLPPRDGRRGRGGHFQGRAIRRPSQHRPVNATDVSSSNAHNSSLSGVEARGRTFPVSLQGDGVESGRRSSGSTAPEPNAQVVYGNTNNANNGSGIGNAITTGAGMVNGDAVSVGGSGMDGRTLSQQQQLHDPSTSVTAAHVSGLSSAMVMTSSGAVATASNVGDPLREASDALKIRILDTVDQLVLMRQQADRCQIDAQRAALNASSNEYAQLQASAQHSFAVVHKASQVLLRLPLCSLLCLLLRLLLCLLLRMSIDYLAFMLIL